MRFGKQTSLVLKTLKRFILHNTHAHPGLLSSNEHNNNPTQWKQQKFWVDAGTMFARNQTSPDTQHKNSAPNIIGCHVKHSQCLTRQISGGCWVKCRNRLTGAFKNTSFVTKHDKIYFLLLPQIPLKTQATLNQKPIRHLQITANLQMLQMTSVAVLKHWFKKLGYKNWYIFPWWQMEYNQNTVLTCQDIRGKRTQDAEVSSWLTFQPLRAL